MGSTPRFGSGDSITNGNVYYTIERVSKGSYKIHGVDLWLTVALVDRVWRPADNETTIEE